MSGSTRYEIARNRMAERQREAERASAVRQVRAQVRAGQADGTRGGHPAVVMARRLRGLLRLRTI
jgi:hypothetical protein